MGTRGMYGFYKNGVTKATYNGYDSYPEGLGIDVTKFISSTAVSELNEIFDRIIMVEGDSEPTAEQINKSIRYYNDSVGTGKIDDWYSLLRETQGNLNVYKEGLLFMINSKNFIKDSLFCEWAYIINLDTNVLEVYRGFQKEADHNRYYDSNVEAKDYKNCKLIANIPFHTLHKLEEIIYSLLNEGED